MTMTTPTPSLHARSAGHAPQGGMTLVEFMVSIVIGMLMVAALATLIADQSANRAEVDRSGRMLENGRYAIRVLADDLQLAGYWGEMSSTPAAPGAMPDPCSLVASDVLAAMAVHVQGYNAPVPAALPSCVSNQLAGTDILVLRRADADSSSLETTPSVPDMNKVAAVAGRPVIQTGINTASNQNFEYKLLAANGSATANATNFSLVKKDLTTAATIRNVLVRIYYVSQCSVPVGTSCAGGDGGTPIPTLKMKELAVTGGVLGWNTVTIAEGIENLQVDYGVDSDSDGAPDGVDIDGSALDTATKWTNVMGVKLHVLARSPEKSPSFADTKTYSLGTAGTTTATSDGYRRHVFVQSVRLVNPSARRSS